MAKFRLDAIANLARQLNFTPLDTRAVQVESAESLLHDLDPDKGYPIDFVVFRITGYQPKTDGNSDLLTGLALQHDLGLLIEQVSGGLNLRTQATAEPVLAIDDVTERFNVTSKTIQRWRRRGLPARRFTFPDGRRRVGFLLSSVERFIAGHRSEMGSTNLCTTLQDAEQAWIVRHGRRLASNCGCCSTELSLRLGKKLHRSPLAILHTLRKHDAEHPADAVLPLAAQPLAEDQIARIIRGHKRGLGLKSLSRKVRLPRAAIYRAIVEARVARLNKRKIRFIDDPLYHQADAERAIADILSQQALATDQPAAEMRVPRDLPPYFRDLYRTPLLASSEERALFLKFNFHKFRFVTARRKLEPEFARVRDLNVLEQHLRDATAAKNEILQANLRLVVSVARRHVVPGVCLMELVSEGNIILMRAVEGFDLHKGNRFSTYAVLALMKGFAQAVPQLLISHRSSAGGDVLSTIPDPHVGNAANRHVDRDHVQHLLNRLDEPERRVLLAHYGLGSASAVPATYEQVGQKLGLSKQRVRQIEQSAMAKLRSAD